MWKGFYMVDQEARVERLKAKLAALQAKWEEEDRLGTGPSGVPSVAPTSGLSPSGEAPSGAPVRTWMIFGGPPPSLPEEQLPSETI